MEVVIAGGSGLIGRHLAASLIEGGAGVTVLSRSPDEADGVPQGARLERWDGRTVGDWAQVVDGASAVVNLAGTSIGEARWTAERKRAIVSSRTEPAAALVQAIEGASTRPTVLVQASAVGYYGDRGDEIVTEEDPRGEGFLAEVCQVWEASTAPVEEMGVRRVIVRTGVVLTAEAGVVPRMLLPFKAGLGGPVGGGDQWLSWIHLEDEVAAIHHLIDDQDARGPYNLTAPTPVTNGRFGKALAKALGRPAIMPIPSLAMRVAFGEMADVLLEGQRVLPQKLQRAGFEFKHTDVEAALDDVLS